MFNLKNKRILVTGSTGFIGQSVLANLLHKRGINPKNIIETGFPKKRNGDLRIYKNAEKLMRENDIYAVIHLAALIGGLGYSSVRQATQYFSNLSIDLNVVEAAKNTGVKKIVLVGSVCAYPKNTPCPYKEEALWDGIPQEANLAYSTIKRMLTVKARAYREEFGLNSVVIVPNNGYGPHDNFHPEYSHVIPSLIRRCLNQENPLIVWGDGSPTRDFFYVKDFAEGVVSALEHLDSPNPINIGSGEEISIRNLALIIREMTGHKGKIIFDKTRPNGQLLRRVDISKQKKLLGFKPSYNLEKGLRETIDWYINNPKKVTEWVPGER
jgi:GDP-L-fucose synthase